MPRFAQYYLGIDLGAESGRVMAGLWDGKRIRLEELHRFPNGPVQIDGTLRWDVLRLWAEIQDGLSRAARVYGKQVCSMGVDTWGVDSVLLSKSNELLGLPYHYRDNRTHGALKRAFRQVSREEIFAATGLQFMELNTLYQLLALKRSSPEILENADCLLMMPDFFHWCLSGKRGAEFTDATTTQFFDPKAGNWAYSLLSKFDLPGRILPKVIFPGTSIGRLVEPVCQRTGLRSVSVVAPASHDTGSAVAAVPSSRREEASWAYLSSGTWSLMGLELGKAQLSKRVLELNFTNEGGVEGTYRLLKNITGLWLVQRCKQAFEETGHRTEYTRLVGLAQKSVPLRSLINPDDPGFGNPPNMPLAIRAFCKETGQPVPDSEGALVRCALESLALRYAQVLENLEELSGRRVEVIHIVGGGSLNRLLNQFTADACNRPVLAGPVEATALGNVLVQARAAGELNSLSELRQVVRASYEVRSFEPRSRETGKWAGARKRFAEFCRRRRFSSAEN